MNTEVNVAIKLSMMTDSMAAILAKNLLYEYAPEEIAYSMVGGHTI